MTELHWTEVDQVITIWTDAPPPLQAGLLFRTGQADETLTIAGQNHLVEHLALSAVSDPAQRNNGFVGNVFTGFFTIGQAQEASTFLASVCEALASLPGSRLESEKQVLAAENAARPYNFCSNLLVWRYGAKGYGLFGLPELGLRNTTIDHLHDYSAQRFTKENAVLWLSGPPPTGLRMSLPHGLKKPLPPLAPIQPTLPSWFVDDRCGGVAAGALVPRRSTAIVFREIAAMRLHEQLRTVQALSYAPTVYYEPLNADTAHLVLHADSDYDHRTELAKAFGEVFEKLVKVDDSEVETAQRRILERWVGILAPSPAERMVIDIQQAAMDWIFGSEFESTESLVAGCSSVTANDVSKLGCDVQATSMFALPGNALIQPWVGKQAPLSLGAAVQGRETLSIDAPINRKRLVNGSDGVSIILQDGSHMTVRYSELAAALFYEDGCVRLIGFDATWLTVEPTLWRDGQNVCRTDWKPLAKS